MLIIATIGVLVMVITLGLGYWSYLLGKRNQSNFVGTIIPVAYFAVRAILAVMTQTATHGLVSSLVGSLLFSLIYYGLFAWGKHRANR
ncbi:integral membrane protein [Lactiplantibacillus plantarum]|nr:integral membrane protein [Lactiplantibacillus plantarum]CDN27133.1 integral membrane protein [Lactiplantibacillus plantarum]